MINVNTLNKISLELGRVLDKKFKNKIWAASIHYGEIEHIKNSCFPKNYEISISTSFPNNKDLIKDICEFLKTKFGLKNPVTLIGAYQSAPAISYVKLTEDEINFVYFILMLSKWTY